MRPVVHLPALLVLTACAKTEVDAPPTVEPPVQAQKGAPAQPGEPWLYAQVERTEAPTPARFSAGLPTTLAAVKGDWAEHPPPTIVRAQLCKGVPSMWEKLGVAVDAAVSTGDPLDEVVRGYGGLLEYCADARSCELAAAWVDGPAGAAGSARAGVGWMRLAQCHDPATTARFQQEGPPDAALARFWFEHSWESESPAEYIPALAAALQRAAKGSDGWLARQAAVAHGRLDDPRVAADLLSAHDAATDPRVKSQIVAGMSEQSAPAVQAVFAAHCANDDVYEAMCPRDDGLGGYGPDKEEDERAPELVMADAALLAKATQEGDWHASWELYRALERLADRDWTAAREAAGPLARAPGLEPRLQRTVEILGRFETRQAVVDGLRELGLLRSTPEAPAEGDTHGWLLPHELLAEHGTVHWFDCETGMFPNEHDGLLAELAAIAGPPMSTVAFEEHAPPLEGLEPIEGGEPVIDAVIAEDGSSWKAEMPSSDYLLHAYTGTHRLTVHAEDLGDWYDLSAVLGLLNSTARELGQDVRFVTLPTGDQTAYVLAAPPAAITAAVKRRLIEIEGASAAVDDGKAFEQQVFEALMREGLEGMPD